MATVDLDTIDYDDSAFQTFLRKTKVKTTLISDPEEQIGFDIVRYEGDLITLVLMITLYWLDYDLVSQITDCDTELRDQLAADVYDALTHQY